jgi:outer membrane protein assembly factor BamB
MMDIRFPETGDFIMRRLTRTLAPILCCLLVESQAIAQRGGGDWMTVGNDAQRSNWVRSDGKISVASMSKPGFEVIWKVKRPIKAMQLNTLTPPSMIEFYISHLGFRSLGFFGGSSDKVFGVDIDLGKVEWEKDLNPNPAPGAGNPECPGGLTAALTRPTNSAYPSNFGGGRGRSGPPKGAVGEPHEGAVTLKQASTPRPPQPPKPSPAKASAPVDNPFAPRIQYAVALSSMGHLHPMWISNGNEANPSIPFIPAGANAAGLISYGGDTYVSTLGGCPSVESGVWAIDMTTKKVSKWTAPGKGVVGSFGQASGPDGTVYVAAENGELHALAAKTLDPLRAFKTGGLKFTSSPTVFEYKSKDMLTVATADGKVHVIDAATMSAVASSEAALGAGYATGALASWADSAGTRWILAPGASAVTAFKLVEKDGALALEKAWTSRALVSPVAPIVVNGVVFALSSGESRKGSVAERIRASKPAVLYALDGLTGKELWNSGAAITSFVHSGLMSSGGSRVYVGAYDGTQYAFSFPMEH